MKTLFTFVIALIAIVTLSDKTQAQSYVKLNPVALAFGSINASYEQVLKAKNSFEVGTSIFIASGYTGLGAHGQYRFYLGNDDAPKGLFVAPEVGVSFGKFSNSNFTAFNAGGLVGYQWLFSQDKFSFQIGIGPAYYFGASSLGSDFRYNGVLPTGTLSLGYKIK
jgi:hypothetical protein